MSINVQDYTALLTVLELSQTQIAKLSNLPADQIRLILNDVENLDTKKQNEAMDNAVESISDLLAEDGITEGQLRNRLNQRHQEELQRLSGKVFCNPDDLQNESQYWTVGSKGRNASWVNEYIESGKNLENLVEATNGKTNGNDD